MQSFVISSWIGGAPCGSHHFDAPNVDHAIGYCRGLFEERAHRQGEAYLALGCHERLDLEPGAQGGSHRFDESTHIGDWMYEEHDEGVRLVWVAANRGSEYPIG